MTERVIAVSRTDDRWAGLQTLIWARLLVAALALPLGVLLRPEPSLASWRLLGVALAVVGVLSAIFGPLLVALGLLAAALRRQVLHARARMEHTARELDRIRFDNDVILRHLTSGVITLDGTGTVAYLNPAAEEVLGLTFASVRGRWVQDAMPARLSPLRDVLLATLERHDTRQ